jgi:hypothetical protein
MKITTIGLDIAKHVFQIHGVDANEKVVVRKALPGRTAVSPRLDVGGPEHLTPLRSRRRPAC